MQGGPAVKCRRVPAGHLRDAVAARCFTRACGIVRRARVAEDVPPGFIVDAFWTSDSGVSLPDFKEAGAAA